MGIFGLFSKQDSSSAQEEPVVESHPLLEPLEGQESLQSTLPIQTISFIFCEKDELMGKHSQMFANELKVPVSQVRLDLERILEGMRNDLTCCIEYPYVDEYYRDTYYSYYSRKHISYNRFCFRISFFSNRITEDNFFSADMRGAFYGYMVLRPTPRRIIGYTFLNPLIYIQHNFSMCVCEHGISVMGRMLKTTGFPFCGQDGEITSCAETAIVMIFDYFSRRYNKYSRLMPSTVISALADNLAERLQPSRGIDIEQVNTIFCSLGMNTRRIVRASENEPVDDYIFFDSERFNELLHIYVESGFPLYATTESHAFLIVGREDKLFFKKPSLIIMDDNQYPYRRWENQNENSILSFLVPLPENVLLDADRIDPKSVYDAFPLDYSVVKVMKEGVSYYHRLFLTTSRSFKKYVVESEISKESKTILTSVAMPRFIWVCETIEENGMPEDVRDTNILSTLVLDATDFPTGDNHLLLIKTQNHIVIPTEDRVGMTEKRYTIFEIQEIMHPFNNNLKGQATLWQG